MLGLGPSGGLARKPERCPRLQAPHRDTPPEDVQTSHGRSPGSRVAAAVVPSQRIRAPVAKGDSRSPLTVAGAASDLPLPAHRIPSWPHHTRCRVKTVTPHYMSATLDDSSTGFAADLCLRISLGKAPWRRLARRRHTRI